MITRNESSIVAGRKVRAAILEGVDKVLRAFLAALSSLVLCSCGEPDEVKPLVAQLRAAADVGSFDLRKLGDRVCLIREYEYPPAAARILFPESDLTTKNALHADGYWYLLIGDSDTKKVKAIAVSQKYIQWRVREDVAASRLNVCDLVVGVRVAAGGQLVIEPPIAAK